VSAEFVVLKGARAYESTSFGERATIGSDSSCDVRLDAPGVMPLHAVVTRTGSGYALAVLDGATEVLVNGVARRECRLSHGTRLVVGGIDIQFLSVADRDPTETWAEFGSSSRVDHTAAPVERVWRSERYSTSIIERNADRLDAQDRLLRGLYLIGNAATAERSLVRLLERAADAVADALHPDRLVIALYEKGTDELVSAVVRRGALDKRGAKLPVSRKIVRKGAVDGVSVLTKIRREGEDSDRSLACVPLSARTEPVGAFYLERAPGVAPFGDDDLDFLGAVGRIVGLSVERGRAEADARSRTAERDQERSRWHAVVQGLRSGVLIVDGAGRVELANPAAQRILVDRVGVKDASELTELGGRPLAELVERAEAGQALEVVLPGSNVVLEVRPSPVLEPDGRRAGAALLLTDVSGERLNQARLAQAEKLSSLGEMLASVAHEINNPLATILGYTEMLALKIDASHRRSLEAILEEAERCRRIVASLLVFARPTSGERVPLDVGTLATSVLDLFAQDLRAGQIDVVYDLQPAPRVLADRYELQQVFFNLLKNAIDAIRGTRKPGRLVVTQRTLDSDTAPRVRVEVRDSGPGFPKDRQGPLVPRPFVTTKGESGTGLGLSIAHGIVTGLGGTMEAGASAEGGALVAVILPAAPDEVVQAPRAPVEPARNGETPRGQRILIVDDESHVRDLLSQIVRELGHVPVCAANGVEALTKIEQEKDWNVVLSDIRMPEMSGDALWRALRAKRPDLAGRVIFLSGDLARAETADFLKEAGRPVLAKPFRITQVCRVIESVLAQP
jgi:two-component system NtrC family sensor kinase